MSVNKAEVRRERIRNISKIINSLSIELIRLTNEEFSSNTNSLVAPPPPPMVAEQDEEQHLLDQALQEGARQILPIAQERRLAKEQQMRRRELAEAVARDEETRKADAIEARLKKLKSAPFDPYAVSVPAIKKKAAPVPPPPYAGRGRGGGYVGYPKKKAYGRTPSSSSSSSSSSSGYRGGEYASGFYDDDAGGGRAGSREGTSRNTERK